MAKKPQPGDILKKVRTGDKLVIPAGTFNAFIDNVLETRRMRNRDAVDGQGRSGAFGGDLGDPNHSGIILVENTTAYQQDRFAILGLDVPSILPSSDADGFKARLIMAGVTPATPTHTGKFAILLEPVRAACVGMAMVCGVCICQVNVASSGDGYADVLNGQTGYLGSGSSGAAQILWKESGTGVKNAVVRVTTTSAPATNQPVLFKVQANATGANIYTGGVVTPIGTDISSSSDLAVANIGTDPSGGSTDILLDFGHLGYAGHSLPTGYYPAIYWQTNSDGKKVWITGFHIGAPGTDYQVVQWLSSKLLSGSVKVST